MKKLFITLALIFFATAIVFAQEYTRNVKKEFSVGANPSLSVENKYGNIEIIEGAGNKIVFDIEIKVKADNDEHARVIADGVDIAFNQTGDNVSAVTDAGNMNIEYNNSKVKVKVGNQTFITSNVVSGVNSPSIITVGDDTIRTTNGTSFATSSGNIIMNTSEMPKEAQDKLDVANKELAASQKLLAEAQKSMPVYGTMSAEEYGRQMEAYGKKMEAYGRQMENYSKKMKEYKDIAEKHAKKENTLSNGKTIIKNANFNREINYKIYVPKSTQITLNNKYGNIFMENTEKPLNVIVKYGNLKAANVGDATIDIGYGNVALQVAKTLTLNSKYSNVKFDKADNVEAVSKYDNFTIGAIKNFNIETKYSNIKIKMLGNSLNAPGFNYCKLNVANILESFSQINISAAYSPINLGLTASHNFKASLNNSYGDINVGSVKLKVEKNKNTKTAVGGSGKAVVNISNKYSDIVFN